MPKHIVRKYIIIITLKSNSVKPYINIYNVENNIFKNNNSLSFFPELSNTRFIYINLPINRHKGLNKPTDKTLNIFCFTDKGFFNITFL